MLNLGILVSGRGSNMVSILEAIRNTSLEAEAKIVVSNKPEAPALDKADDFGVKTEVVRVIRGELREDYDRKVVNILKDNDVDTLVLAGFMRIITPVLIEAFENRIINIHPALLPSFQGLHAQKQALDYGVKVTGCTTHFVDSGVDTGPIILQETVPVLNNDTEKTLSGRILEKEHEIIVKTLQLLSQGKVRVENRRVLIDE